MAQVSRGTETLTVLIAGSDRFKYMLFVTMFLAPWGCPKNRSQLTEGKRHQLRDALILEGHSAAGRNIFVTEDAKGFIKNGWREQLESLLGTRIHSHSESESELASHSNRR